MNKRWKKIPGYEDIYDVSSTGDVRSWYGKYGNKTFISEKSKLFKQAVSVKGYNFVVLSKKDNRRTINVHRLVAVLFIKNPENKPCVNHINGVKTDNRVENLEWVTYQENTNHAIDNDLIKRGERNETSKLTRNDVLDIRNTYMLGCFNQKEIAKAFNITRSNVSAIITERSWAHV